QAVGAADGDSLMQRVSSAARTISWASDDAWRRIESWLEGPRGRAVRTDKVLSPGVVLREDQIVLERGADVDDEALPLRVADGAAQTARPVSRDTLARL